MPKLDNKVVDAFVAASTPSLVLDALRVGTLSVPVRVPPESGDSRVRGISNAVRFASVIVTLERLLIACDGAQAGTVRNCAELIFEASEFEELQLCG